jgi:hypothetical protein
MKTVETLKEERQNIVYIKTKDTTYKTIKTIGAITPYGVYTILSDWSVDGVVRDIEYGYSELLDYKTVSEIKEEQQ